MTAAVARGLLDTSVFVALESGRPMALDRLPDEGLISPVTLAELRAGVLVADDLDVRARRLATLDAVADIELLVVDDDVASEWARLRVHLAHTGRRVSVNDLWIAATACAHDLPVVTQDDDFAVLIPAGVQVVRVCPPAHVADK